jgi:hypothetical protein
MKSVIEANDQVMKTVIGKINEEVTEQRGQITAMQGVIGQNPGGGQTLAKKEQVKAAFQAAGVAVPAHLA